MKNSTRQLRINTFFWYNLFEKTDEGIIFQLILCGQFYPDNKPENVNIKRKTTEEEKKGGCGYHRATGRILVVIDGFVY